MKRRRTEPGSQRLRARGRATVLLVRVGGTTAVGLGVVIYLAVGSALVAVAFLAGACIGLLAALAVLRVKQKASTDPIGALWAGRATIRVCDLLTGPLLDSVRVRHEDRVANNPTRGAPGRLVLDADGFTWSASWPAEIRGVRGVLTLPWTAVVRAQAAALPTATADSGAVVLMFADDTKVDFAFAAGYPGFRATLARLPRPLPGLGE